MLGLLSFDQFSVTVTVSKQPLHRLLVSSIITGASRNMGGEGSGGFGGWRGLWSERSVRRERKKGRDETAMEEEEEEEEEVWDGGHESGGCIRHRFGH
ncbi:hypothetical protein S83_050004 [Arachis hypogaea]